MLTSIIDYVQPGGAWDIPKLSSMIPTNLLPHILGVLPPRPELGHDRVTWRWGTTHRFTVASAYQQMVEERWNLPNKQWCLIWSFSLPQRVRLFLWLILKESFMTNIERCRHGLSDYPSCLLFHLSNESITHIFHDCAATAEVWQSLVPTELLLTFFVTDTTPWILSNLCCHT
ncbi:hypothetical protein V6N12_013039 [Hibiscus sabdariffa]|uniref:Reverse transcriptase zinc-binding domain-containing protein n=1 Tax=Hibiscus sabdariffa TaxID=183260 RepID=A0ABR2EG49_9ROSI